MNIFQIFTLVLATFFATPAVFADQMPAAAAPKTAKVIYIENCATALLAKRQTRLNIGPDLDNLAAESGSALREFYVRWLKLNVQMLEIVQSATAKTSDVEKQKNSIRRLEEFNSKKNEADREMKAVDLKISILESRRKRLQERIERMQNSNGSRWSLLRATPTFQYHDINRRFSVNEINDNRLTADDLKAKSEDLDKQILALKKSREGMVTVASITRQKGSEDSKFDKQIRDTNLNSAQHLSQILLQFFEQEFTASTVLSDELKVYVLTALASPLLEQETGLYYGTTRLKIDPKIERWLQGFRHVYFLRAQLMGVAVEKLQTFLETRDNVSPFDVEVWRGILIHRFVYSDEKAQNLIRKRLRDQEQGYQNFGAFTEAMESLLSDFTKKEKENPSESKPIADMMIKMISEFALLRDTLKY